MPNTKFTLHDNCYSIFETDLLDFKASSSVLSVNSFLICTEGTAKIEINIEEYVISKDTCIYLFANSLLRTVAVSNDFKCHVIIFDKSVTLSMMMGFETELLQLIHQNPVVYIDSTNEINILNKYLEIISTYKELPEYGHHYDFICGNIRCLTTAFIYSLRRICGKQNATLTAYNSSDNYFREFMKLLSEHSRTQHDVTFYAKALNITPKYLNEICRKKAHTTAKEVITQYVIAQIKREILLSGNPVQRIAYDFNFSDQSSFGKYFKKAVGMSPMAFRKTRLQQFDSSNIVEGYIKNLK